MYYDLRHWLDYYYILSSPIIKLQISDNTVQIYFNGFFLGLNTPRSVTGFLFCLELAISHPRNLSVVVPVEYHPEPVRPVDKYLIG